MKNIAIIALSLLLASSVYAAPCRGKNGRFVKCPAVATSPLPAVTGTPAPVKKLTQRCRNKGKFVKCPSPASPVPSPTP